MPDSDGPKRRDRADRNSHHAPLNCLTVSLKSPALECLLMKPSAPNVIQQRWGNRASRQKQSSSSEIENE